MWANEILATLDTFKNITPELVDEPWDEVYAGDVKFRLPNGWILVVFNDCGDWDYIDSIIINQHNKISFWGCPDTEEIFGLRDWEPENVEVWKNLEKKVEF